MRVINISARSWRADNWKSNSPRITAVSQRRFLGRDYPSISTCDSHGHYQDRNALLGSYISRGELESVLFFDRYTDDWYYRWRRLSHFHGMCSWYFCEHPKSCYFRFFSPQVSFLKCTSKPSGELQHSLLESIYWFSMHFYLLNTNFVIKKCGWTSSHITNMTFPVYSSSPEDHFHMSENTVNLTCR